MDDQVKQTRDLLQSMNSAADAAIDGATNASTKTGPRGGTSPGTGPSFFKPVRVSMPYEK